MAQIVSLDLFRKKKESKATVASIPPDLLDRAERLKQSIERINKLCKELKSGQLHPAKTDG
jgi:hypothetical protein